MRKRFVDMTRQRNAHAACSGRRIRVSLSAAVAFGMLSTGQVSAQDVERSEPASAPVSLDKDGKICEYEVVTGSRMRKRVCYTPERWEALGGAGRRAAKAMARELDNRPVGVEGGSE